MKLSSARDWFQDQLKKHDVNIWVIELHKLTYALDSYWKSLSIDEKEKAHKFKTIELKNHYTISRGVLRRLISLYLNMPVADIKFAYNIQGKPKIDNHKSIFFNLSHSKDLALIAFSKVAEVGVDLEFMDSSVDFISLSKLVMTTEERELFKYISEQQQIEVFYKNWTRKEAFVKGSGVGLQFDLKKCFVGLNESPQLKIQCASTNNNDWTLKDIQLKDKSFKAALALGRNKITNASTHYYLTDYVEKYH